MYIYVCISISKYACVSIYKSLSQARGGGFNIKRREGGAGGGRSASPRKASHEWCPQDYSISLLSLESVYKCAQYSCSTHVGCKLKQKHGSTASMLGG